MSIINVTVDNFNFRLHVFENETLSNQLREKGYHGYNDIDILKLLIKPNSTVLDIGANIGWYTVIVSHLVGNNGKIYAVEADQENINILEKNLLLNNINNVKTHRYAAADYDGVINFYKNPENYGDHSISSCTYIRCFVVDENYSSPIQVPCIRLDTLLTFEEFSNVSLIKMDIQGGECRALAGLEKHLKQYRPPILVEYSPAHIYHADSSPFELFAFIDKNGYLPYRIIPQGLEPVKIQPMPIAELFKMTEKSFNDFGGWIDLLLMPS